MGSGTNFDPHILEDAYAELAKIPTTLQTSRSMRNIAEASNIRDDVSANCEHVTTTMPSCRIVPLRLAGQYATEARC